jgi:TonB family protein
MKALRQSIVLALCVLALGSSLNAQATLESAKPPFYPLAARAAGIEGAVTLKGTISVEGKMQSIHDVTGPPELQQAAIDSVKSWKYKPYSQLGKLVEVNTSVTVNFNMGNPKQQAAAQARAQAELEKAGQPTPSQNSPQPPAAKE